MKCAWCGKPIEYTEAIDRVKERAWIEAAAKVIAEKSGERWDCITEGYRDDWRDTALAALQAADALRTKPESEWKCKARASVLPEPADCNWPFCGWDPTANKVIEAIEESGLRISKPESEWNEAIEAAALIADHFAVSQRVRNAVRALKRMVP